MIVPAARLSRPPLERMLRIHEELRRDTLVNCTTTGHFEEAVAEAERAAAAAGGKGDAAGSLSYVLAAAGQRARAEAQLDEIVQASRQRFVQPYYIALTFAALGRAAEALEWLHKAVEIRSHFLVLIRVDPRLDDLRSRPEFAEIVKEVGA